MGSSQLERLLAEYYHALVIAWREWLIDNDFSDQLNKLHVLDLRNLIVSEFWHDLEFGWIDLGLRNDDYGPAIDALNDWIGGRGLH